MKMRFLQLPLALLVSAALVMSSSADPILPFQDPIAAQINADLTAGTGDAQTLNRALAAYHKTSKSLKTDMGILQNLNSILANTAGYPPLLLDASIAYQNDFAGRRDELTQQLIPAPITASKDAAQTSINKLDKSLLNAVTAPTFSKRLNFQRTAAGQIISSSNSVQRALKANVGLSIMKAQIGALDFNSDKGFVTGGTNFQTSDGDTIGEITETGVLTLSAIDAGSITRGLHLHVEGVTGDFPAMYSLGVGNNNAFYDATDVPKKREYHFQVDPLLTNNIVTGSFLSIDYIGTNFMLGRFAFRGTNSHPIEVGDTNTVVTVSGGQFQLNFNHQ
ncbi:MAG TPA: hypothetical protein VGF13_15830 [Verrucomicrobiae bacterium]|jgi:hypothetical protein